MKKILITLLILFLNFSICYSQEFPQNPVEVFYTICSKLEPDELWKLLDKLNYWDIPLVGLHNYYNSIDDSTAESLRNTLHDLIDDHTIFPYDGNNEPFQEEWEIDSWDILALADQHPEFENKVLDFYKNATFEKAYSGNVYYQREHLWPQSRGFKTENEWCVPRSDCHHIVIAYGSYNGSRSNSFFANIVDDPTTTNFTELNIKIKDTEFNLGLGGGDDDNYAKNGIDDDTKIDLWQVWSGKKGDVARAIFYMAVRYNGDADDEPNLILSNDINDQTVTCPDCYANEETAKMGLLNDLLKWHKEDSVDDYERRRNSIIYLFQGNRNPFIDNPEWVEAIWNIE